MTNWTRRRFIRAATLGGLGALAAACSAAPPGEQPPPATPTSRPLPLPTQTGRAPLTNENRPAVNRNWNVRYFRPYVPIDHDLWRLTVDGLVDAPGAFSLDELRALPRVEQNTRMKCVECWSARAQWAGFTYAALAEIVRPRAEATWVTFECADGYYESLSVAELSRPRVLLAYEMDGALLLDEFGAPLRLIVPPLYGYKGPKAITRMRFTDREEIGYWPTVGPYSPEGFIQPGRDLPLDLNETRTITGGEITDY